MKTATYTGQDGKPFTVEYDENAPCVSCGLPVLYASMGGTGICAWCDCGQYRDGTNWAFEDALDGDLRRNRAREIMGRDGPVRRPPV